MASLTKSKSSRNPKNPLPAKPYPEFPLTPHRSGKWCKRINGRLIYFGRLDNWEAALAQYEREMPYLKAGKPVPVNPDGLTLADLCNHFLAAKDAAVQTRELTKRSFEDYRGSCKRLVEHLGKKHLVSELTPADFQNLRTKLAKRFGVNTLANEVNRVRVVFNFGAKNQLLDKPVCFGSGFKRPTKKTIRKHRAEKAKNGDSTFTPDEIRKLLDQAAVQQEVQLRAMILLGINAALGNTDVGLLETAHVDLEAGWLDFPRPKTGIDRKAKLWPQTVEAIKEALKVRPKAKSAEARSLVFRTKYGQPWAKDDTSGNPVSQQFRKLLNATGVYRPGLGFYSLRHTFATISREVRDDAALRLVLGHDDGSMLEAHYTHGFPPERLETVATHAHRWLFGEAKTE